ncbi:MAG TPA: glycosyltransferase family 39 protein [Acidobacteriaceae bacterium]|nr:glycosyltransferase family 39 protein [Acidobacteriaceae bacterium]
MAEPSSEQPFDRPLPLRLIFPLLFVGVYLTHLTLLRLPYYWDEAGYYIPAAYDFFRTGSLIPTTTLPNGHPPLPSLYLALWWQSGFTPAVTRTAMCLVTAIALLAVYRLGMLLNGRPRVAATTTLLTALYPIWFAQSTLAHADMFAAAGTLWGLVFVFPNRGRPARWWAAAACFAAAAWSKETAVVTPLTLAVWEFVLSLASLRNRSGEARKHALAAFLMLLAPATLLGWYAYFRHRTGFLFGNPEYLRYNATATLSPLRILLALAHRILQLTAHMNMFVPVLCTLGAMLLLPVRERDGTLRPRISPSNQAILYAVLAANVLFFSVLGGALLTRYLLPMFPLVLLLCVSTFYRRVPYWWGLVLLTAAAFVIGLFVNPPYKFAPEDNLSYADVIRLHQAGIRQIVTRFPGSTVLTAWPATDELSKPELGYVKKPVPVVAIANFSLPEIQKAAASPKEFSASFVFSTKYDPPHLWMNLGARNEAFDTRFFDFHRDLGPGAIAHLLDGNIVWREERDGEWAAVLHLNRPQVAKLEGSDSIIP